MAGLSSSANPAKKLILLRIDNLMAKTAGSTAAPSQDFSLTFSFFKASEVLEGIEGSKKNGPPEKLVAEVFPKTGPLR
jgi:hypothetical protein